MLLCIVSSLFLVLFPFLHCFSWLKLNFWVAFFSICIYILSVYIYFTTYDICNRKLVQFSVTLLLLFCLGCYQVIVYRMSCTSSNQHSYTVGVCTKSRGRSGSSLLLFAWHVLLGTGNGSLSCWSADQGWNNICSRWSRDMDVKTPLCLWLLNPFCVANMI